MKQVLLLKYGEIALRGNNRRLIENYLIDRIHKNIAKEQYSVTKEQGRILIESQSEQFDYDYVIKKIKPTLGIVGICPCIKTKCQDIENLKQLALEYMKQHYGDKESFTFKVETKRADKRYPLTSNEVSYIVGGYIFNTMENARVNVVNPEVKLYIELRNDAYIYSGTIKGMGGLPAGCSGKGMVLLSGGIDSPVAAFLAAKRGVSLNAVYFHSPPYTSERALNKVYDLAKRLAYFTGELTLFVVPFTDVQLYLLKNVESKKLTIFLKRAMLNIAEKLALNNGCQCLITGDSIGQVASQTLSSIQAVNSAAAQLPIIRPLAGLDKQEIVNIAKNIETFDISSRPYEDCCTIFVDKHPETKPLTPIIQKIENKLLQNLGYEQLILAACNSVNVMIL